MARPSTRVDGFTINSGSETLRVGVVCIFTSPTIANNIIAQNASGGIRCSDSSATITSNLITGGGDGIYCYNSSSPTITNNVIANNSVGIKCQSSSAPVISNNLIKGNKTGSGIYCSSSSPTISNNVIVGNSATGSSSGAGGGIHCVSSSPTITNNTIMGNYAGTSDTFGGAGGLYCYNGSSPAVSNNIIAFNSSGISCSQSGPTLRNNDVYGNAAFSYSGIAAGTGDISADPLLADAQFGDAHIRLGSPCIDAGWNDAPGLPAVDMDGQARVQAGTVDIGADEFNGTEPTPVPHAIIHVSPDGDDGKDGSSWALAKRTVQAGLDAASDARAEKCGSRPGPTTNGYHCAVLHICMVASLGPRRPGRNGTGRRTRASSTVEPRHCGHGAVYPGLPMQLRGRFHDHKRQRTIGRRGVLWLAGGSCEQHDHGEHGDQLWRRDILLLLG